MTKQPSSQPSKPKSERRRREAQIKIRVTAEELAAIESNAAGCGLTTPELLRRLGQGYVPRSKLDQRHIRELCSVAGDLGRLGGLLKLWLIEKRAGHLPRDSVAITEVDGLWRDIQKTYTAVKERTLEL